MSRLHITAFVMLMGGTISSCSNDPISDLPVQDSQVFITNYDSTANYRQYQSFSVVDSVILSQNDQLTTRLTPIDVSLLLQVIRNMENLGYEYVGPKDNPDLGISVEFFNNSTLNIVQTPVGGYWGNYWGGFGGWGYGMPSYYSYLVNETYWSINMLDFVNADTSRQELPIVWNGQIRGDGVDDGVNIRNMIDQLFSQSTYLQGE